MKRHPLCVCSRLCSRLVFGVWQFCGPDKTFVCARCRRSLPWCLGAEDDMPEVCDDCWCLAHGIEPAEVAADGR